MKHKSMLALIFAALPAAAIAQSLPADETSKGIKFAKTTEADREILQKSRPVENRAVPVPKFLIKSQSGSFYMAVGGQINTIIGTDLGNDLYEQNDASGGFTTADIPIHPKKGHKSDFFINPMNADIDFQIVGLAGTDNEISGYIKLGTPGNLNSVNLKKAYVTWRGITAGAKTTLFQDGNACQPPTIDTEGPSGEIAGTVYGIHYVSPTYSGFQFAAGLDMPSFCNSNGVYQGKDYKSWIGHQVSSDVNQNVPDIPLWVQYTHSANNRIRLSGILRTYRYHDLVSDKIRGAFGWGLQLSGNLQPIDPLILYVQAVYGQGIGNYIQDLSGLPLGWIPKDHKPGRVKAAPMMGLNFGATYNFSPKWQANALVSQARIWDVADYANALDESQNYKYALYAGGNVFYNVTNYLQVGIEALWGKRATWNHSSGNDTRIQAQVMFTL